MLSIHLGDYPGSIYDTETYFRNSYLDSWFEDPMAAQIIKSVDGSELIGPPQHRKQAAGLDHPTRTVRRR